MLNKPANFAVVDANQYAPLGLKPLSAFAEGSPNHYGPAEKTAAWMHEFLVRPNVGLGRPGPVCPFIATSERADLAFIVVSSTRDEHDIHGVMLEAVAAFDAIACARAALQFRCVLVVFPACDGEVGRATLKRVQNRLRPESTRRGKMIGLFEPNSNDRGLINPDFRPLRSPLPLLAIRSLVEGDAAFVLRNPRLAPLYLWRFPRSGPGRLWQCWRR